MTDFEDDDDWQDIIRTNGKAAPADATILLSKKQRGKYPVENPKAYATLALRNDLAVWALGQGPRFKLQIGGKLANKIRLMPDAHRGAFEVRDMRGTAMISLGHINVWPDEHRAHTGGDGHIAESYLVITLPADFATPRGVAGLLPPPEKQAQTSDLAKPKAAVPKVVAAPEDDLVLRAALGITDTFPQVIGGQRFTPAELRILEVLLGRSAVTTDSLMIASRDPAEPTEDDRDPKIVDVYICKIRKKLDVLGIGITREYGGVFRLNAPSKGKLRDLVEKARA